MSEGQYHPCFPTRGVLFCTHSNLLGRDVCRGFFLIDPCMLDSYRSYKAERRYICISDMNQGASFVGSRRVRNMDSLNPSKLSLDLIEIEYFFDTGT